MGIDMFWRMFTSLKYVVCSLPLRDEAWKDVYQASDNRVWLQLMQSLTHNVDKVHIADVLHIVFTFGFYWNKHFWTRKYNSNVMFYVMLELNSLKFSVWFWFSFFLINWLQHLSMHKHFVSTKPGRKHIKTTNIEHTSITKNINSKRILLKKYKITVVKFPIT